MLKWTIICIIGGTYVCISWGGVQSDMNQLCRLSLSLLRELEYGIDRQWQWVGHHTASIWMHHVCNIHVLFFARLGCLWVYMLPELKVSLNVEVVDWERGQRGAVGAQRSGFSVNLWFSYRTTSRLQRPFLFHGLAFFLCSRPWIFGLTPPRR